MKRTMWLNIKEINSFMLFSTNVRVMKRVSLIVCVIVLFVVIGFKSNGQKYANMAGHSTLVVLKGIDDSRKKIFEENTAKFLDAINLAYRGNAQPVFPDDVTSGKIDEIVKNNWAISPFISVRTDVIENVMKNESGNYEIRNIQIVLEEADADYKQQDAVIIFDQQGKIIDFKIALGYHSISAILRDTVGVTDLRRRQLIVSFVEDFRTAYNLKDNVYLDKVFSDRALIITGKTIEKSIEGELKSVTTYTTQTKEQYLNKLKAVFANSKLLNINFDSINVIRHPNHENIYGVNLYQTWNSEKVQGGKYNDVGYVFLIIDFADESKPMIWVRAWSIDNFFSMNSFTIE